MEFIKKISKTNTNTINSTKKGFNGVGNPAPKNKKGGKS